MRTRHLIPVVVTGLCFSVLIGCASPRPYAELWVESRPYHAERADARPDFTTESPSSRLQPRQGVANPTGPVTLGQAVTLALRHNPQLASAGIEVAAAELDAAQAGRSPNPRVSVGAENWGGPDAGDTFERQTLRLSQVIELGGKRQKRLALGQATQRLRAWDYEASRIDVAAEVASRYLAVVVAQDRVSLLEKQHQITEAGYNIAADRAANGEVPLLERDQAETRVALARIALEQARKALDAARADLVAMWGAEAPEFTTASGALDGKVLAPSLETLKARLSQSPAVARWDAEIEQRESRYMLERANGIADPTMGGGVRYFPDADDVAGVVELSVPLTIFDDRRHATAAARLRVAQAKAEQERAVAEVVRELARAYARYESAAFTSDTLDNKALPAAQSAYEATLESYQAGATDYLNVLDTERMLLNTRNSRLDAMLDYHQAVIDLERLTGQSLAEQSN